MSEPLWCPIRQHYCRCHDFGARCDDEPKPIRVRGIMFRDEDDAYEYFRQLEVDGK